MFNIDFSQLKNTDGNFLTFAGILLAGFLGYETVSNGYSLTGGNAKLIPGNKRSELEGEDEEETASGDDPEAVDV